MCTMGKTMVQCVMVTSHRPRQMLPVGNLAMGGQGHLSALHSKCFQYWYVIYTRYTDISNMRCVIIIMYVRIVHTTMSVITVHVPIYS